MEQQFDPERLRPAEYICERDPRSTMWVRIDRVAGTSRTVELADHHDQISGLALHAGVPREVLLRKKRVSVRLVCVSLLPGGGASQPGMSGTGPARAAEGRY